MQANNNNNSVVPQTNQTGSSKILLDPEATSLSHIFARERGEDILKSEGNNF